MPGQANRSLAFRPGLVRSWRVRPVLSSAGRVSYVPFPSAAGVPGSMGLLAWAVDLPLRSSQLSTASQSNSQRSVKGCAKLATKGRVATEVGPRFRAAWPWMTSHRQADRSRPCRCMGTSHTPLKTTNLELSQSSIPYSAVRWPPGASPHQQTTACVRVRTEHRAQPGRS